MATADEEGTSAAKVEAWVREELHLGADTSVEIGEKPGNDPRCSPVVTEVLIAAPGQEPYAFHIERPLRELEPMDLIAALAFGGGHRRGRRRRQSGSRWTMSKEKAGRQIDTYSAPSGSGVL